jgi:hypothetical protein
MMQIYSSEKKKIYVAVVCFLNMAMPMFGARDLYIYNDTNETVTIKGPTKPTNKTAIPVSLDPKKVLIRSLDSEGTANDLLDLSYIGNTSKNIRKYSKKYDKPINIFIINWTAPQYGFVQAESSLNNMTTF